MRPTQLTLVCSLLITNTLLANPETNNTLQSWTGNNVELVVTQQGANEISISADLSNSINALLEPETARLEIRDEDRIGIPGYPDLPAITRLFVIPPTGNCELAYTSSTPRLIEDREIPIFQDINVSGNVHSDADPSFLQSSEFWPPHIVKIDDPVIMRGVRMVRLSIFPLQINPASGEIHAYDNIEISLNITAGTGINPVIRPERPRPSGSALKSMASIVSNPELLRDDFDEKGAFVYVIPNFNGVAEAIAPLVQMRKMQGYPTEVITVAANASNVDVKNALQEAYDEWDIPPEIICLVGEADRVNADFMIATWDVGRAYMWETDYKYGLLEGQDLLPEAAVGRISARSLAELRSLVAKITGYEMSPYVEDTTWFTRGAVMANDSRTGYSSIYLQRWARKLLLEVGFAEVDTFYFIHQNQETDHNFVRRLINQGISVFNYRGWGQFNGAWVVGDVDELRNDRKRPLMILPTCNTCDFADHILSPHSYAEDFLWAQNGGAIGTIGSSGFTHTNYNNVLDGGILNSFYRDGVFSIGWALNRGKLELYRHFGMFNDVQDPQVQNLLVWEAHCYQFNLIGDPGTELWTGLPAPMTVSNPDTIYLGEQNLQFQITDARDGSPIPNATVTLLVDGEPLRNVGSDVDGNVLLTFSPNELIPGEMILTVTRHNNYPVIDTIAVIAESRFLAAWTVLVDDDNAGRSRGNGDRIPNPGEIVELRTQIINYGDEAVQGAVDFLLEHSVGDYEIVTGAAHLNQAPAMGDSTAVTFVVQMGNLIQNNQRLVFSLTASTQNETWTSTIALDAGSFDLEYAGHTFTPDPFRPGDTVWVDLTLRNIGRMTSPQMTGRLISQTPVVSVFNPQAEFDAASVDGNDSITTARFRLYAHPLTVPGTPGELLLTLESEAGMRDTTRIHYTIGSPGNGTPFGPDKYGYVCFDNTDEQWEVSPVYNWIEIDTGLGGDGQNTEIHDQGNEQDWSVLVELPFPFKYYGQEFREITICSNGWFAFGDESKLADFQNRRIPPALGPRAQVCVFWDDLISYVDRNNAQIGGIFYKFDEQNNRFIIEWSRMRRYVGMDEDEIRVGSEESFQAILFDPQHYQTYTGDGDIVFQYRDVSNDAAVDPGEFDTPYATVGIVNLNGTDGLEYTFWNTYTPGAAVLADERAIKFSTKLIVVVGCARGSVTDVATGLPIPNAEIRGSRGSFTITDRNGSFLMNNVLIGEDYSFTAWAPGYNDSTLIGFDIFEDDTVELNFALLHPTFSVSLEEITAELRPGFGTEAPITLRNEGNGPLSYSARLTYPGIVEEGVWPLLRDINATEITGDNRIQSAAFFYERIWVAGSNNNSNPNKFYRFTPDGRYSGSVDQPGTSSYGVRGSTTDGTFLYGGEGTWIYKFDPIGVIIDSIPGPFTLQRALAYDYNHGGLWVANGIDDPIVHIDSTGEITASFDHELDINGLAYFPDDPDGFPLYILSRDRTNPNLQIPEALISKLNPETGDMRVVTPLEGSVEDRGGEIEITSDYDSRKWILIAAMTNLSDTRISVYDLGPNTNWLNYSPRSGILNPGREERLEVTLNASGLEEGEYSLILRYLHNAANLRTDIPVRLTVDDEASVDDSNVLPNVFALHPAYPNPFNATTQIRFDVAGRGFTSLSLFDLSGRKIDTIFEGELTPGRYSRILTAEDLPSGIYVVKLKSGATTKSIKIALVR